MHSLSPKERILLLLSFVAPLIFSFVLGIIVWPKVLIKETVEPTSENRVVVQEASINKQSDVNIVLLGGGGAGHDGGGLTDAIVLLNIDPVEKVAKIISIPRDLWVRFQGQDNKINHAFLAGPGALKDAVTSVTGITPQYFVSIDFNSFQKAIDEIGGVTVNVPVAFDDHYYPIKGLENESCGFSPEKIEEVHRLYTGFELEKQFECRYEHLHFERGPQEMSGEDALKFVRSRHSAQHGGDFARGERQQALLLGVKDRLINLKAIEDAQGFFEQLRGFVNTDMDITVAVALGKLFADYDAYKIKHITLTTDDVLADGKSSTGAYILFPKEGIHKWDKVIEYISSH